MVQPDSLESRLKSVVQVESQDALASECFFDIRVHGRNELTVNDCDSTSQPGENVTEQSSTVVSEK